MQDRFPPHRKVVQQARCMLLGGGTWFGGFEFAQKFYHWDRPLIQSLELKATAAASGGDLAVADRISNENFFASTHSRSIQSRLASSGMAKVPLRSRVVSISLAPSASSSAGLTQSDLTKTKIRPVSKLALTGSLMEPQSVASYCIFSEEALDGSGANDLIELEMANASGAAEDAALIDWLVGQFGGSNILEAEGLEPLGELARLEQVVCLTGSERPLMLMRPELAIALSCRHDPVTGIASFPDMSPQGGLLGGVPVMATDQLPQPDSIGASTVALIDATGLVYGSDGLELDTASAGMINLATDPATDSPEDMISLFQSGCVCLRMRRYLAWRALRTTACALMTGASWDQIEST